MAGGEAGGLAGLGMYALQISQSLAAWRLSVELADELHGAVVRWPEFDRDSVGLQLMRSVDSVGANIAEAAGRWSAADKRRFLLIARGSLYETEHWIDRARAAGSSAKT